MPSIINDIAKVYSKYSEYISFYGGDTVRKGQEPKALVFKCVDSRVLFLTEFVVDKLIGKVLISRNLGGMIHNAYDINVVKAF